MKKYLLLFLLAILAIPCSLAQGKDKKKMMEELQQFKIDYIVKEIQLSEKEKAEFIPLYTEYDRARRQAGSEAWKFERELKKKKDVSEADYKKLYELQQIAREKDNEIVKTYDVKFEKILSAKQIYTMHQAEGKFLEKMKEMRKKNHDGKHPHDRKDGKPSDRKHNDRKDAPYPSDSNQQMPFDL
ncbi:MAG: hypothetical protein K2N35_07450 [Muribaculaceae bacterium]|nr:hypothetical protein [Muribaculaceae bacterium]